jgi:hypothetical protein
VRSFVKAVVLLCLAACTRAEEKAPEPAPRVDNGALCGPTYPELTPGMAVKVGALRVKLAEADPTPPRQKVPNHWTLEISNESGAKVTDVTLSNPDSFMPVHNHHGRTRPTVEAAALRIRDIDFNMRGPWQVLVDLTQAGNKLGTATFQVCVQ